ncbi:MAG: peptidylprolyl isomerase, partial [Oxalobacteraceae bacterium]
MKHSRRHFFTLTLLTGLVFSGTLGLAHAADVPQVSLKTSMGEIVLELYPEKAPKSVANFLQYVKDGHYNNTIFHRVIEDFMIQGGGFDRNRRFYRAGAGLRTDGDRTAHRGCA